MLVDSNVTTEDDIIAKLVTEVSEKKEEYQKCLPHDIDHLQELDNFCTLH